MQQQLTRTSGGKAILAGARLWQGMCDVGFLLSLPQAFVSSRYLSSYRSAPVLTPSWSAPNIHIAPQYNFLCELPRADREKLRKLVIDLVLGTDMQQHFTIQKNFLTQHRETAATLPAPAGGAQ